MGYITGSASLRPTAASTLRVRHTAANGTFLVVSAPEGASPADAAREAYGQLGDALRQNRLEIVQERVFGSLTAEVAVKAARREALWARGVDGDNPLNYVQGRPAWGHGFAGVIMRAVSADSLQEGVRTLFEGGTPRGRTWRCGDLTYILLQDVRGQVGPGDNHAPATQAQEAIQRADRLLRECGAGYGQTVRTWFYLSNILHWYGEFNRVRNELYEQFGLLPTPAEDRILPASTGIRADLSHGAVCSLDLLAVTAPGPRGPVVRSLRNPRQQEAYSYGSAFSRCAVVQQPGETLVQISGTAAIDERGISLHPGDVRAQVRCTLDKVAALIGQTGAALTDIGAATIFVKNGEQAEVVRDELTAMGLESFPAVFVVADVCRGELLFELDAEAVVAKRSE